MQRSRANGGFTLVELLVVIAIIGVLVALLLPAVQAAREAARRSSCSNNIKQLAIGIHNYHDTYNCIPFCYLGPSPSTYNATNYGKSWMTQILPFIEQKPLYDQIDWTRDLNAATAPAVNNNIIIAQTVVKTFLCPSDGNNGFGKMSGRANVGGTWAVNNYKGNSGANWAWNQGSPNTGDFRTPINQTPPNENVNAPPVVNTDNGLDIGNGIICRNGGNRQDAMKSFSFVTDGLSNTFAVGEAVPAWCTHTWWWWFNGTTATCAIPLNYRSPEVLAGTSSLEGRAGDWPVNYSFMSRHPGGGQFALVDGSVRFIPNTIDLVVYRRLATAGGGQVAQLPN
jgi:prepilin-type N-terminal cleavage/methylation domain-containing protein/prepilin-type processing-associated H-X9-DG protein